MRSPLLAAAAALLLWGCKPSCGSPGTAPATSPSSPSQGGNPSAPVPDAIQALRDADAALQAGKLDEAIARGETASAAMPGNPVIWNVLGRAHAARFAQTRDGDEAKKAREAFTRATTASPDFWPAYQNLGELEEKTGRLQEAADAYRQVLKAQPNHPDKAKFEAVIGRAQAGKQ
ncbi:MAG TPA: tetratricopeptide repeat protein [Myxococcaceae bacterium]|jgi:tetratricopeptide (TPR) repeat protein